MERRAIGPATGPRVSAGLPFCMCYLPPLMCINLRKLHKKHMYTAFRSHKPCGTRFSKPCGARCGSTSLFLMAYYLQIWSQACSRTLYSGVQTADHVYTMCIVLFSLAQNQMLYTHPLSFYVEAFGPTLVALVHSTWTLHVILKLVVIEMPMLG